LCLSITHIESRGRIAAIGVLRICGSHRLLLATLAELVILRCLGSLQGTAFLLIATAILVLTRLRIEAVARMVGIAAVGGSRIG